MDEIKNTNVPEKKFRAGTVSATVWQNKGKNREGEGVIFRTVSLQRGYKDREGTWKNTASLRANDLPRVTVVLQKAYEYLVMGNAQGQSDEDIAEEVI